LTDAEIRALQGRGDTPVGFGNPLRDLDGDAAYLAAFLRTISGPIVLVGHSYGGNVISAAAAFAATPSAPPAWYTLPCWYLLGTEDKAIPPELQRYMAERAEATIVEVPASHVSFVSQPEAATQLILQAIEATAAAS
jgi:pimeloyl-ACP methyl ester carboxylesterase